MLSLMQSPSHGRKKYQKEPLQVILSLRSLVKILRLIQTQIQKISGHTAVYILLVLLLTLIKYLVQIIVILSPLQSRGLMKTGNS